MILIFAKYLLGSADTTSSSTLETVVTDPSTSSISPGVTTPSTSSSTPILRHKDGRVRFPARYATGGKAPIMPIARRNKDTSKVFAPTGGTKTRQYKTRVQAVCTAIIQ